MFEYWISYEIEDAYIVPVNIAYEKLPEHCDTTPFTKSSFSVSILTKMFKYVRHGLGFIRVNFGQPFTLRVSTNNKTLSLVVIILI
jgi:glycerol-3-phosphate O-acyltransferase